MTHAAFEVPDEQKVTFTLKPIEGQLLRAATVGASLRSLARILKAKDEPLDPTFDTFLVGMTMTEDGGIEFELLVLPKHEPETEQ